MTYRDATRHRVSTRGQDYFITCCTQSRHPYFQNFRQARQLAATFQQMEQQAILTFQCWVIMPDHIHLLVTLTGDKTLSQAIATLKVTHNRQANRTVKWQQGFYERTLRREEDRKKIARYIIANPIRAGLTNSVRNYPHWDCIYI